MKKLIQLFALLFFANFSFGQGSFGDIQGRLYEKPESNTPASFANVWVERGATKFTAMSDENGRFIINSIPVGVYPLKVTYLGDTLAQTIFADVKVNGIAFLGRVDFYNDVTQFEDVKVYGLREKLIDHGNVGERRINSLDISRSPAKNSMVDILKSRNSDIQTNSSGEVMIRGSRPNDLIYYIDGVKMGEIKNVPSSAIGSVTVYTNAIPAKYGDTNGGVIIMETKSYYDLYMEHKLRQPIE